MSDNPPPSYGPTIDRQLTPTRRSIEARQGGWTDFLQGIPVIAKFLKAVTFSGTVAAQSTLDVTGAVTTHAGITNDTAGAFNSQGAAAGFNAYDRNADGKVGTFYRSADVTRLYSSVAGDVLSYDDTGIVNILASYLYPQKGMAGNTSFPGSPTSGIVFYRSDKQCWYHWDGTHWNIVGVEQTAMVDSGAITQTISTTAGTAITGTTTTITTTGSGVILCTAQIRCNVAAGATLLLRANIGGTTETEAVVTLSGGDVTVPVVLRTAVGAAATTCKLEARLFATGPPNATISSAVATWTACKS